MVCSKKERPAHHIWTKLRPSFDVFFLILSWKENEWEIKNNLIKKYQNCFKNSFFLKEQLFFWCKRKGRDTSFWSLNISFLKRSLTGKRIIQCCSSGFGVTQIAIELGMWNHLEKGGEEKTKRDKWSVILLWERMLWSNKTMGVQTNLLLLSGNPLALLQVF